MVSFSSYTLIYKHDYCGFFVNKIFNTIFYLLKIFVRSSSFGFKGKSKLRIELTNNVGVTIKIYLSINVHLV